MDERSLRDIRLFYQTYNYMGNSIWGSLSPVLQNLLIRASLSPEFPGLNQNGILGTVSQESSRSDGDFLIRGTATTKFPGLNTSTAAIAEEYFTAETTSQKPANRQILVSKLINNLSYSHFIELIKINEAQKRLFYEIECIKGTWSVRELKRQINSLYFERSGISTSPETLSKKTLEKTTGQPTDTLIKDIYAFEFLGLPAKDAVEESDLETALLDHLREFILELGNGFCLEARQKRILIGDEYFFLDLVFYHRILKCHVLVELKVDEFSHANAGQLNTYLNYYKEEVKVKGDNDPIGILLVTHKNEALVKYATAGMDQNLFCEQIPFATACCQTA